MRGLKLEGSDDDDDDASSLSAANIPCWLDNCHRLSCWLQDGEKAETAANAAKRYNWRAHFIMMEFCKGTTVLQWTRIDLVDLV